MSPGSAPRRSGRPARAIRHDRTGDRFLARFSGRRLSGATESDVRDKYNRLRGKREMPRGVLEPAAAARVRRERLGIDADVLAPPMAGTRLMDRAPTVDRTPVRANRRAAYSACCTISRASVLIMSTTFQALASSPRFVASMTAASTSGRT